MLIQTQSRVTFASICIFKATKLRELHEDRSSLRAHNSASTLKEIPILRVNPLIHTSLESQINLPPLDFPGFPNDEPSELNLYHPTLGLFPEPPY